MGGGGEKTRNLDLGALGNSPASCNYSSPFLVAVNAYVLLQYLDRALPMLTPLFSLHQAPDAVAGKPITLTGLRSRDKKCCMHSPLPRASQRTGTLNRTEQHWDRQFQCYSPRFSEFLPLLPPAWSEQNHISVYITCCTISPACFL